MAVSPQTWDKAALDRIFDGTALVPGGSFFSTTQSQTQNAPASAFDFIIRQEDKKLPAAPRYALNLSGVPPQFRHTVTGFEQLFHKNQEETAEWVDHVNAIIRQRNAANGTKTQEWTDEPRPNEPPYTCLSDAAGAVNDWWALQLGKELPTYQSANNGSTEVGLINPRLIELKYLERAHALAGPHYLLAPKLFDKDPVRGIGAPAQPLGYADILIEDKPYQVTDPYTGEVYGYTPGMSAMEGQYKKLFAAGLLQRTPEKDAQILADGIEKWGIAYVQLESTILPRLPGSHTVAVVGYFCMEAGQEIISCSGNQTGADWGRTAYFIVHDSFGNFPPDKTRDASGGSAYRAVRIESIDKAIVFPHSLAVTARPSSQPNTWQVSVANKGGRPVQIIAVHVRQPDGTPVLATPGPGGTILISGSADDEVLLDIEARHYYEADGKARTFLLRLSRSAAQAWEIPRTPPTKPRR